jgi:hypothetical protein
MTMGSIALMRGKSEKSDSVEDSALDKTNRINLARREALHMVPDPSFRPTIGIIDEDLAGIHLNCSFNIVFLGLPEVVCMLLSIDGFSLTAAGEDQLALSHLWLQIYRDESEEHVPLPIRQSDGRVR